MKSKSADSIVIGGGLAGLISAIELARAGYAVTLLEKKDYPRHKVCGEYISNEVKPYLQRLDLFPQQLNPKAIKHFQLTAVNGLMAECDLELGGFGISRYALDNFLFEKARAAGVHIKTNTTVTNITFTNKYFRVETQQEQDFTARLVIAAHGKRSLVDKALKRKFIKQKTSYVGIKHHFKADFPDDVVALHNFEGGYCGLSRVENDHVNLCYLTSTRVFKRYQSIAQMEEEHLSKNPFLRDFLQAAEPVFKQPLVISQINFSPKPLIENHVLMCGDAAGLIHPLCGNGMAMAIQGAKICTELVKDFLAGTLKRPEMEKRYTMQWQQAFAQRLYFGRQAQNLFGRNALSSFSVRAAKTFPDMLRRVVSLSHGSVVN